MPVPILAANWKLHKTQGEALAFVEHFLLQLDAGPCEVVLCPPFTSLAAVGRALDGSGVALGAQDVFWERHGAFTGEVSVEMLRDCGCRYVIVGHSERRQMFGETDQTVQAKVRAALAGGLVPIICVGETLAQRRAGQTDEVVLGQLRAALVGALPDVVPVVAYEPVWAIGTGVSAGADDAGRVASLIRGELARLGAPWEVRIQYGGSVKPDNIAAFMAEKDIDGALVGGASLDPDVFAQLVKAAVV